MGRFHDRTFPQESEAYRTARDELLAAENELRQRVEEVAALRRKLPLGGRLKEDYIFDELDPRSGEVSETSFSQLFEPGRDSLILYSYMYGPDWEKPCPMCTSIADNLDGAGHHVRQRANLAVCAKAPVEKLRPLADDRRWSRFRLLSSSGNTYNSDYHAEWDSPMGNQHPLMNVFTRRDGEIFHFWASELLFVPRDGDPRHVDMIWALWNLLDLTPEGRGQSWYPALAYP